MTYKPKHFILQELVDRQTFADLGERGWMLFRPDALRMLDDLREFLGAPCTVNNWHRNGQYQFSGFRPMTFAQGAKYSAHRLGCGFDLKVSGMTPAQAWAKIQAHPGHTLLSRLLRVEDVAFTPTWLHVDTYEHGGGSILVVKP